MLRITREGNVLRLEGQIIGPWVEELRRAVNGGGLTIDLSDVTFADWDGAVLLAELRKRATLTGCSAFLKQQIQ